MYMLDANREAITRNRISKKIRKEAHKSVRLQCKCAIKL